MTPSPEKSDDRAAHAFALAAGDGTPVQGPGLESPVARSPLANEFRGSEIDERSIAAQVARGLGAPTGKDHLGYVKLALACLGYQLDGAAARGAGNSNQPPSAADSLASEITRSLADARTRRERLAATVAADVTPRPS